jgi:iron complex transport system substrate-binding protein
MTPQICRVRPALLALLCSVLLTACGAGGSAAPSDDAPAAEPAAAASLDANLTDGCVDDPAEGTDYFPDKVEFAHATGVSVTYENSYKVVDVTPLGAEQPVRYVLHQCGAPEPQLDGDLADAQVIAVPVASVISLTTTNLPHFAEMDRADRVIGVGTAAYVTTPEILDRAEAGDISDYAGPEGQPDLEGIISAAPDLLIMDAFGDAVVEEANRFIAADVPTVLNADFNEQQLLGRAEWLKFTALFLNTEADANTTFAEIESSYDDVKAAAADADETPTVFVNQPFEGTWFVPAGNSFFASAIADANGEYVFDEDTATYSLELDIETVLNQAKDADIWLQAGSVHGTLDDLLAADERFAEFKAFAEGDVYAYDKATNPAGGNPVFETAYTRADEFLADLVSILHPDALPDHERIYFGKVGEGADG